MAVFRRFPPLLITYYALRITYYCLSLHLLESLGKLDYIQEAQMNMSEEWQSVLERLFFVTERLLVFDSLDDVFTHILRSAKSFSKIDAASIQAFDLKTGNLHTVKAEGLSDDYVKYAVEKMGEGIGGRVVAEGKPFFTTDVSEELYSDHRRTARENGLKAAMAVPLKTKAGSVGCLTVFRKTDEPFGDEDIILMSIFASIAAEAIEKRGFIASLKQHAIFDPATGLYNRGMLLKMFDAELNLAFRHQHKTAIIMIKLDDFEEYVSLNGNLLGSKVLRDFARLVGENCRRSDIVGRMNEETIVIVQPYTTKDQSVAFCGKLRSALAQKGLQDVGSAVQPPTFSAGISEYPDDGDSVQILLKKAEAALAAGLVDGSDRATVWVEKGPMV